MPPKVFRRPVRDQGQQEPVGEDNSEKLPPSEKCTILTKIGDINLKFAAENFHVMERVHTLTSILAGVVAGLFNAGLYSGIFAYLALHLIITLLILATLKNSQDYFLKKTDLLGGLGSGIMVFLCGWIITYNVVYTL